MADQVTPTSTEVAEEPSKAPSVPKLDPTKSFSQQNAVLNKIADSLPETKGEEDKGKEPPKEGDVSKDDPDNGEPKPAPSEPKPQDLPSLEEEADDEDEEAADQPKAPAGSWQEYVRQNLPKIPARIMVDGKAKTVYVQAFQDLPEGYSWQSEGARDAFFADYSGQEARAEKLVADFNQKELQTQIRAFEEQENKDVIDDLAYLQRQGILDEFQYKESDPKFNDDPAVKTANEIYDLMKKTNAEYAKRFAGTNRTFRISYRDAADKYFAAKLRSQNPEGKSKEQPTAPVEKTPLQKDREAIARKQGATPGGTPESNKLRPRTGMTMNDIRRLAAQGRI